MVVKAVKKPAPRKRASKRFKAADGPTTAYRDGPDGIIEVLNCDDGWIPSGWTDTPAKCKNPGGKRVEVL